MGELVSAALQGLAACGALVTSSAAVRPRMQLWSCDQSLSHPPSAPAASEPELLLQPEPVLATLRFDSHVSTAEEASGGDAEAIEEMVRFARWLLRSILRNKKQRRRRQSPTLALLRAKSWAVPQSAAEQMRTYCAQRLKHKRFQPFAVSGEPENASARSVRQYSCQKMDVDCVSRDPATSPLSTEVSNEANDLDVNDLQHGWHDDCWIAWIASITR